MADTKVKAIPEGLSSITPSLVLSDTRKALDFYKRAFGAQVLGEPAMAPDGRSVWHVMFRIGNSTFFAADEAAGMGAKSAKTLGTTPVTFWLYVEDADGAFKKATDAGAKVTMPLADMFWGDRFGSLEDPFGNQWAIAQHIKDPTPEEMKKAMDEMAKQAAQKR